MTHSESDFINVKALMLLQSSKPDATNALRSMLIETIFNKHGTKRQMKPIPPLWQPNESTKVKEEVQVKSDCKPKSPLKSPQTISSTDSSDDSEDALEILEPNLTTCSVCRGERFNSKTHLIECSECHLLYHKDCHNPPITEDLSDPRVVWYCRNCNKPVSKPKASPSLSGSDSSSKTSSSKSSSSSSRSQTSSSSKTFGGTRIGQSKSSSSTSQGKSHVPSINIISADKRLQIMKKKAARKQDKRSTNK